jgi:2-hydroxycyclohexanecarboxyl-CoA dehydrogenase
MATEGVGASRSARRVINDHQDGFIEIEEKRYGIRANALTPSLVHGTASTERITSDEFSGKLFARAAQQAQLGVPTADDIAELTVFLRSPAAARLTGQAISVNGGISAA